MNWVKALSYGMLSGGLKNGFVMFDLELTGAEPESKEAVAELIMKIQKNVGVGCKRIHIKGVVPPIAGHSLFVCLKSIGFDIYAETTESICPSWFDPISSPSKISFMTVRLSSPEWAPYPFNELIYEIASPQTPEPTLPENFDDRFTPLFVTGKEGVSKKDLMLFILKSKHRWNINCEIKTANEVLISNE